MTLEQMGAVMDVLTVAYPQYYRNVSDDEKFKATMLWAEMFADNPVEIVIAAVKSFISTDEKGFPPHIGAIKSHVVKMQTGPQGSEQEAWTKVKRALRNSTYGADQEFATLPPEIQRIIGAPSQLREWAQIDVNTLDTVVASNFQRSYRAIAREYREYLASPSAVRQLLDDFSETKHMGLSSATPPENPKALPISVEATVESLKAEIGIFGIPNIGSPMPPDEFEKRRAEILRELA